LFQLRRKRQSSEKKEGMKINVYNEEVVISKNRKEGMKANIYHEEEEVF